MDRLTTHSSLAVAPLQISKGASKTGGSAAGRLQVTSTTTNSTWGLQQPGQMTPPLTPCETEASFERHPDFQTYLRAFYPFHPSCADSSSTVTLPLNAGDIVLVHSVHTNGWADGSLLSSGARGWLPTNYCETYSSQSIRNLLRALTVFWDLTQLFNVGGLAVFRNSDYVRGLVAGVRCLLVRTCFTSGFQPSQRKAQSADKMLRKTPTVSTESLVSSSLILAFARIEKRSYQTFHPLSRSPKGSKVS